MAQKWHKQTNKIPVWEKRLRSIVPLYLIHPGFLLYNLYKTSTSNFRVRLCRMRSPAMVVMMLITWRMRREVTRKSQTTGMMKTLVLGEITPKSPLIEGPRTWCWICRLYRIMNPGPHGSTQGKWQSTMKKEGLPESGGRSGPHVLTICPLPLMMKIASLSMIILSIQGIGIGDDIPNLPASVNGDTDAGFKPSCPCCWSHAPLRHPLKRKKVDMWNV